MKRDMDLVRQILITLENYEHGSSHPRRSRCPTTPKKPLAITSC
jgi:hypothetical protein